MKAMVFAAGLGTRLRPLTDSRPKALVEVSGVPMLEHVIRHISACGFNEIIINVHHFGDMVIDFINSRQWDAEIRISDERGELLDTGGGILKVRDWLDDGNPFLVHNADILTDLDLAAMYRHHVEAKADVTLLTAQRETARYLVFDKGYRLRGWTNIKTGEVRPDGFKYDKDLHVPLAFGGVHVIGPTIFASLAKYSAERKFSITPYYVSACRELRIMGYSPTESYRWFDIGKPETLALAEVSFGR